MESPRKWVALLSVTVLLVMLFMTGVATAAPAEPEQSVQENTLAEQIDDPALPEQGPEPEPAPVPEADDPQPAEEDPVTEPEVEGEIPVEEEGETPEEEGETSGEEAPPETTSPPVTEVIEGDAAGAQPVPGADAGLEEVNPDGGYLSISGYKWELCEENGGQVLKPVPEVTIELWMKIYQDNGVVAFNGTGSWVKKGETKTLADGSYSFTGLWSGIYEVREVLTEEQKKQWYPVNPADGKHENVELECEQDITDRDFINARYLSISGHKWENLKGDGVHAGNEPGVPDVKIELVDPSGQVIQTTTTAADGSYSFTQLMPGTYTVREVLGAEQKEEWYAVNPADGSHEGVELKLCHSVEDLDFLNCRDGSISGIKLVDNGDGILDATKDTRWEGMIITLEGTTFTGNKVSQSAITDIQGDYSFQGLKPGTYTVTELYEPGAMVPIVGPSETVTLFSGEREEVNFLNGPVAVLAEAVTPPVTPQAEETLPATGMDQLTIILEAMLLIILGLILMALGIFRSRKARI